MNLEKLKQAEASFLERYPDGFHHPEMVEIGRKHKMEKMITLAQDGFAKQNFKLPDLIIENMTKVITRSSMISVFEKPKFRDFAYSLPPHDRQCLSDGLEELIHGNEQRGFETMAEFLKNGKQARWSLMTICQTYYRPQVDVFMKPTTVKGVIEFFELKNLQYKPTPVWAFYEQYRDILNEMKSKVDPSLSTYNAAFSGFLMMSIQGSFL